MRVLRVLTALLTVAALGVACSGDDEAGGGAKGGQKAKVAKAKTVEEVESAEEVAFRYDPTGKPDPFRSYVKQLVTLDLNDVQSPLQRFDLSQLNVTGIVWKNEEPRALIQDPTGKGYIVQTGAAIGKNRGRIVRIEDNRVVVKETYVDHFDQATTKEVDMYLYERNGG